MFQNVLLRNDSGREQDVLDFCAVWTSLKLIVFAGALTVLYQLLDPGYASDKYQSIKVTFKVVALSS